MSQSEEKFLIKLNQLVPTNEHKMSFIASLLGAGGVLAEFMLAKDIIVIAPVQVQYALSLLIQNLMVITKDWEPGTRLTPIELNPRNGDYSMSEQTQERIYRCMKEIVITLYDAIKENENV